MKWSLVLQSKFLFSSSFLHGHSGVIKSVLNWVRDIKVSAEVHTILAWPQINVKGWISKKRFIRLGNKGLGLRSFWYWMSIGLDRTGDMSFLTRTPKFVGLDLIPTYIFEHFDYQVQVINCHKIRSLNTNLVLKVSRPNK